MSKVNQIINIFSANSIHFIQPNWKREQWRIVIDLINRRKYLSSPRDLEKVFSSLTKTKYSRCFNLARSAVQISLEAFQFPSRAEIIMPSFSCAGVITPVISAGLTPVLVDVDRDFNISAVSVSQAISENSRAIILPLLSGKMAKDFFQILDLAKKNNLKVIVDASQALGLSISGKWAGNYGDAGIYSFNGGKLIPGSGGGVLVTNNDQIISYCKKAHIKSSKNSIGNKRILHYAYRYGLHNFTYPINRLIDAVHHRSKVRIQSLEKNERNGFYAVEEIDCIEAALILSQLKFIPELIEKRQRNATRIIQSNVLQNLGFILPEITDNIFVKFLVTHLDPDFSTFVRRVLSNAGIETEQSYTPLFIRPFFNSYKKVDTPITDQYWKGTFALPINPLIRIQAIDRMIHVLQTIKGTGK